MAIRWAHRTHESEWAAELGAPRLPMASLKSYGGDRRLHACGDRSAPTRQAMPPALTACRLWEIGRSNVHKGVLRSTSKGRGPKPNS